jgi:hypothetical protein
VRTILYVRAEFDVDNVDESYYCMMWRYTTLSVFPLLSQY